MSLPYKVGKLYRPIQGIWFQPLIDTGFIGSLFDEYGSYMNYQVQQPRLDDMQDMYRWNEDSKAIAPIAFVEKTQMVVCEAPVQIREKAFSLEGGNGIAIKNLDHVEWKIVRFEVPVEDFIKNFELVL